jgi:hypothetical protein
MKYVIGLMLASLSMFTYAQRTPLACQDDDSAGLKWEAGKWIVRSFVTDKFILVKEGGSLTTDSVAKALRVPLSSIKCEEPLHGHMMCHSKLGKSMYYSHANNKGGISSLFGATMDGANRDTVTAQAFTCTPF